MVKCLTHGLRGFNGTVQRRLATLTGDSLTARVKMQHEPAAEANRPRSRVSAAFLHLQWDNRPFWPLVSEYTIVDTFGDFSHTVEWNSLKYVWQISLYTLA